MTRWDLVYKWSDPKTQSLVDAVTSALENCDRKLTEARAASASVLPFGASKANPFTKKIDVVADTPEQGK